MPADRTAVNGAIRVKFMPKKILAGLALVILTSTRAAAAPTLDLDTFIQVILENNPGVQQILEQQAIAEGQLESSLGIDDPLLGSSGTLSRNEFDDITGFEADNSNQFDLGLSLDRTFSQTGTRMGASYSNRYVDRSPALNNDLGASYHQPSLTLRLTQPLLKNRGGVQDRLDINLNQLNLEFNRLDSREQLDSYITRLSALYLDWYQAYRETEILEEAHQKVVDQEKLVKLKIKRQIAEPHELLRIQETREDYYSRWQQALGSYLGLSRQVEKQMNLQSAASQRAQAAEVPLDPTASALLTQVDDRTNDYLATDSRLKAILVNLQEQQEQLVIARDDARKADLALSLGYTRHGADSGAADAHTSEFDSNDYSVMLEYRYPLGNRRASGDFQAQIASRRQVQAGTSQQLIDAEAALADLQVREKQLATALAAADRKIDLARRKIDAELELYRIGQLDLFELQQDATTQLESLLNRTQLYVRLQQIRLSIGELLDYNLQPFLSSSLTGPRVN